MRLVAFVLLLLGAGWLFQRVRRYLIGFVSAEDFSYWVHCLITVKENGGTVTIRHPESRAMIRIERAEGGSEDRCRLFLDIPRTSWSEQMRGVISEFFEGRNLSYCEPADRKNVILRVQFSVDSIWNEASGAVVASTVRDLFSVIGVARDARFRLQTSGANSPRLFEKKAPDWIGGDSAVLRWYARKFSNGYRVARTEERKCQEEPETVERDQGWRDRQ